MKKCLRCKINKPFSDSWKGTHTYGLFSWCKLCKKEYEREPTVKKSKKEYYKKPHVVEIRKKYRNSKNGMDKILKQNFGITIEEYQNIFDSQSGACAICKRHQSFFKTRLNVDHRHSDGLVRGLLCGNCNRGIGFLEDSSEYLKSAINYLEGASPC